MNDSAFIQCLKDRQAFLETIIAEKNSSLNTSPPGKLRIIRRGKQNYYYHRKDPQDTNGTYIPRKDFGLAHALAQKEYDQKMIEAAKKDLKIIQELLKKLSKQSFESCNFSLSKSYGNLIQPVILSDEAFAAQWQNMPYQKKRYWDDQKEFFTNREERVRSKSELLIANALDQRNIPYRYECACNLRGFGPVYPDFTVLNLRLRKVFLWEHLGMMDDPEYVIKAMRKLSLYENNGYYLGDRLILTHETSQEPLKSKLIDKMIDTFLI